MKSGILLAAASISVALACVGGGAIYYWRNSPTEVAKREVLNLLDDPDSARFADVKLCRSDEYTDLVIGKVNSKNKYGGYDGNKLFITEILGDIPHTDLQGFASKNVADYYVDIQTLTPYDKFDCGKAYDLAAKKWKIGMDASLADYNATNEAAMVAPPSDGQ